MRRIILATSAALLSFSSLAAFCQTAPGCALTKPTIIHRTRIAKVSEPQPMMCPANPIQSPPRAPQAPPTVIVNNAATNFEPWQRR